MTIESEDLRAGALMLITILAVAASACTRSPARDTTQTRAIPTVTPTAVPAATGAPAAPTQRAAMTPTAHGLGVGQELGLTPTPSIPAPDLPAEAEHVLKLACEDLAQRLSLALESVRQVSIEAAQWRDASLGCPRPGVVYAQVITPGYRVVLEAAGQEYAYHADRGQLVVMCEEEFMVRSPTVRGHVQPGLEAVVKRAREDLAERLSIPVEQVEVLEAKSVVWPDGGLGCPEPGLAYTQVPREGVLIRLRAEQRMYSYHGGAGTPPFLCQQATTHNAR